MNRLKAIGVLLMVSMQVWSWTSPVDIPEVGDAHIRIVGQNARNYLLDFTASNASCKTQEAFDAKTDKMANVFIALQADIVAICEVEQNSGALQPLCDAMNRIAEADVYTYLTDDLGDAVQSETGYMSLKSGFIYRKDKVAPKGSTVSPYYSNNIYYARMRIQAFRELATNEVFVLSMNHFKAKDDSQDAGEGTRVNNTTRLLNKLNTITTDPDILIIGDLNAYMGEQPIINLQNAAYEEQLVRFDSAAYSYKYYGEKGLLDHVLANSTMAQQVTGAKVYHINTSGKTSYQYSDHDASVVGLRLGEAPMGVDNGEWTNGEGRKVIINGQLMIEYKGIRYDIYGRRQ